MPAPVLLARQLGIHPAWLTDGTARTVPFAVEIAAPAPKKALRK